MTVDTKKSMGRNTWEYTGHTERSQVQVRVVSTDRSVSCYVRCDHLIPVALLSVEGCITGVWQSWGNYSLIIAFLSISTNCQNICISDNHVTPMSHDVVYLIRTTHKWTRNQHASQSSSHLGNRNQMVRLRKRQWCRFLTKMASLAMRADRPYVVYMMQVPHH